MGKKGNHQIIDWNRTQDLWNLDRVIEIKIKLLIQSWEQFPILWTMKTYRNLSGQLCFGKTAQRNHLVCKEKARYHNWKRKYLSWDLKELSFLNNKVEEPLPPSHLGSLRENKFILKILRDRFDAEVLLIVWKENLLQNSCFLQLLSSFSLGEVCDRDLSTGVEGRRISSKIDPLLPGPWDGGSCKSLVLSPFFSGSAAHLKTH